MENQTNNKIELRSDDVREILERPPHSLVRYGTLVVCFILSVLFIGSFIFRYPDTIGGEIVITAENPPVRIVAKSSGRIKELYCKDKASVNEKELIAVIENPANTKDVLTLKKRLTDEIIISDSMVSISPLLFSVKYELGELQPAYSSFNKMVNNYLNFLSLNLTKQDENLIHKEIEGRNTYLSSLRSQLDLRRKELIVAESSYEREKSLLERGVISRSEFEATEQDFLSKQQNLRQLEATILSEGIESVKLRDSANRLSVEYLQDKNNKYADLLAGYQELVSEIEKWEQTYLLTAPQSGSLTFNTFWTKDQEIKTGDKVFAIVPGKQGRIIGKMQTPLSGSGKIKVGQDVNIKLSGYPYLEYGMLKGIVRNISLVANNNFHAVEIEFPSGLVSTMGKEFDLSGELIGVGEVITENRSVGERIISPLRYMIDNNM